MSIVRFNIRVYGLLLHDGNLLVADELIKGHRITKFPGGGMEFGEGPLDCLVREIKEELGVHATDLEHFYTTDFFQPSAFREGDQIISIYYTFKIADPSAIAVSEKVFDFADVPGDQERFRWLELASARVEDVTLPIDRVALAMLLKR